MKINKNVGLKYLNPENKTAIDNFVAQFVSIIDGKVAIYVSGPITTGKNFVDWFNRKGKAMFEDRPLYSKHHRNDVIEGNLDCIKDFAHRLRLDTHDIVIEPASYDNPDWSQQDYLYYWTSIIEIYVKKIICLDGWQYSRGCVFEYFVGRKLNLDIVDQQQQSISNEKGISLIADAIFELADVTFDIGMHRIVHQELKKL